jgi:hypothetical protein
MADRNEEQRSPEDARLIKRTTRAYFIQKNLPEAFADWVGELESEMVEALGRASQTMDPCAFLEAFRDLLRKHRTSNWPVLLFSETLTSLFRRLAVKVVLEAHLSSERIEDLYRFNSLYRETVELLTVVIPSDSPTVKSIKQELEVFARVLRKARREIKRKVRMWLLPDLLRHPFVLVAPRRRWHVRKAFTIAVISAATALFFLTLHLIPYTRLDQLVLEMTNSLSSQYRSVVGTILTAVLILVLLKFAGSMTEPLPELKLRLIILIALAAIFGRSLIGWWLQMSIVALAIAIGMSTPFLLAIRRTLNATLDYYLKEVRKIGLAVVVACFEPDKTIDEITDRAWDSVWAIIGHEVSIWREYSRH